MRLADGPQNCTQGQQRGEFVLGMSAVTEVPGDKGGGRIDRRRRGQMSRIAPVQVGTRQVLRRRMNRWDAVSPIALRCVMMMFPDFPERRS
ncbi:MAG: hypothetical protein A3G24_07895 [Betaproteobacteria bacterium RIFCSPLOWO2_12_FULL_62_13]|nr:MAG: hypothetical protein A3G24_07895 [Betaproteobacteria bacterium RIFCSPLOWO2_12_FULL_62_13]